MSLNILRLFFRMRTVHTSIALFFRSTMTWQAATTKVNRLKFISIWEEPEHHVGNTIECLRNKMFHVRPNACANEFALSSMTSFALFWRLMHLPETKLFFVFLFFLQYFCCNCIKELPRDFLENIYCDSYVQKCHTISWSMITITVTREVKK